MRKVSKVILHCSASDSPYYTFDVIKQDHIKNRKFDDIGYHYGVDYRGHLHILRPIGVVGAHAAGHNKESIGVCLLGNQRFETEQYLSLSKLLYNLMEIFDLALDDIIPHTRVNPDKSCPNFDVVWFKRIYMEKK